MKTLAFGEVLWDIYPDNKYLGGATMNFSAHFKKCGGEVLILTTVGNDFLGKETLNEMYKFGIETKYVTCSDKETGKCLVTLDKNKIPSYDLLDNVAYDDIKKPYLNKDAFDVLYFGTLALRNENNKNVLKQIISENKFENIFVDINIRPPYYSKDVIEFALKNATIIKISDEELPVIMETLGKTYSSCCECAEILCKDFRNLKIIIITKGENGSLVYDISGEKFFETPAEKVETVSTVGAGDSFSASFLSEYLKTKDIQSSLLLATKISGFVVSVKDAIPDYELSDFE